MEGDAVRISGVPLTRRWLIPEALRPKLYWPHPVMSSRRNKAAYLAVWDRFYSLRIIWRRSSFIRSVRSRLAFIFISKLYRQMYANTGLATDSARAARSARWARWLAKPCRYLFSARPMPQLQVPKLGRGH